MTEGLWTEIPARQSFVRSPPLSASTGVGQADMRQSPMIEGGAAAGFDVPIVGQNVVTAGIGSAAADCAERIELVRDAQNADGGDAGGGEVLRHIVGTRGAGDASRGGSEFARDKFKERRFAGAVVAHDGSFGARGDGQVYSFEQKLLIAGSGTKHR